MEIDAQRPSHFRLGGLNRSPWAALRYLCTRTRSPENSMSSSFCIRRFDVADTAALSALWLRASLQAHPFLTETVLHEQQHLIETLYLPKADTWLVCIDDVPVGFIGLLDNFIGGLFVDPAHQGKGLGAALITHALTLRPTLSLDVYALNEGAHRFYVRLGFVETARSATDSDGLPFETITLQFGA